MPRCNSCSKFVSLEELDPEVQSLDVDNDGTVTAEIRIVNACAECGEELTEAIFDLEETVDVPEPEEADHEHELEIEEGESAERTRPDHTRPDKSGVSVPARYRKTWYGFAVTAKVTCTGCPFEEDLILADDIQASAMEPLS